MILGERYAMYLFDYLQKDKTGKLSVDKLVDLMVVEYNPPQDQIDYVLQLLSMEELMIPYGYLYDASTKHFVYSSTNREDDMDKLAPTVNDIEYGIQEFSKFSDGWLKESTTDLVRSLIDHKEWLELQFEENISVIPILNKLQQLELI